jgi:hypothetical protein
MMVQADQTGNEQTTLEVDRRVAIPLYPDRFDSPAGDRDFGALEELAASPHPGCVSQYGSHAAVY